MNNDLMELVFTSTYHLPENIEYLYHVHILLIFVLVVIGFILREKLNEYKGLFIFFIICSFFYYQGLESQIELSKDIHSALKNKTHKVVYGQIENFKPMHPSGHGYDTFDVKGISFSSSHEDYKNDAFFFNMVKVHGSPIKRNGQKVKIFYLPPKINKVCLPFIPECLNFKDNRGIIKLWVENTNNK